MKKLEKPNIVMIMTDDQGYWGMGCAGNEEIMTPNLDKLAKKGMLFENFFCASPVCSPARASIFTGKIPSQHGIHDWIDKGHINEGEVAKELRDEFDKENLSWEYEWSKRQLKGDQAIDYLRGHKSFTEILAEEGYTCGLSGKWHLGDAGRPQAGFTYWRTTAMGGDNYYYPVVLKNDEFVMERETYVTDYITNQAIKFMEQEKGSEAPFYLSVHYTAPHAPWDKFHHPEEVYKLYEDCIFETMPNEKMHPWGDFQFDTQEEADKARLTFLRGYATATTAMDIGVGQLIDNLEKNNMLENTIIIFTSDNGMSMGHHGIYGKGNGTFPLNMYDTAVKVPMIISYPKEMKQNIKNDDLLSHYDILPTILNYLGLDEHISENLPGCSFAPLLEGKELGKREDVVIMDEYGPTRMIRTKEWKYIHRYPYGPHELYDIKNDPDEKTNLIDSNKVKPVIEDMKKRLEKWYYKYVDLAVDGKGEAVTGKGQINRVGIHAQGKESFCKIK